MGAEPDFAGAALAVAGFTSSFFMKLLMVSFAAFSWPKDGIGGMDAEPEFDGAAAGFAGFTSSFFMKLLMVSFATFSWPKDGIGGMGAEADFAGAALAVAGFTSSFFMNAPINLFSWFDWPNERVLGAGIDLAKVLDPFNANIGFVSIFFTSLGWSLRATLTLVILGPSFSVDADAFCNEFTIDDKIKSLSFTCHGDEGSCANSPSSAGINSPNLPVKLDTPISPTPIDNFENFWEDLSLFSSSTFSLR